MNIIWLDINSSWSHSSLAIPALDAQLKNETREKCNFKIVSGTIKSNTSEIIEQILEFNPDYIFSTAWLFNVNYLLEILGRVSNVLNLKGIFLGGPEFLGDNFLFLNKYKFISAVFKGEGEEMYDKFIESLLEGEDKWKNINGFEWIDSLGYHKSTAIYVKNFSELHAPETSSFFNWDKSFVQLETSRGCFNSCRFCISGIDDNKQQYIGIENLRNRINNILKHNIHSIRILDRTFNANAKRAINLLNLFNEFAGKITFHLEIHPALLNDTIKNKLESLSENLLHIEAGMQTLQQKVLDICKRKGDCDNAIKGLCYLIGIKKFDIHADLIAGLPNYKYNELIKDVVDLMRIQPAEIQLESLKLLPGTYFRNYSKELKIKYSPFPPYEILESDAMTYRDINKSMVLSKILDLWYNDVKWRGVFCDIFASDYNKINSLVKFFKGTEFITQPLSLENKGLVLYKYCKDFIPEFKDFISLQWLKNGLSIKKEPAENLIKWDYNSTINNPLLNKDCIRDKYYYLEINGTRHWFAYNKELDRVAPYKYISE